ATAAMSTPCRDALHIMALLKEKLAGIDAGFGVDLLRLDALRVGHRQALQNGFAGAEATHFREPLLLADRLANRFETTTVTVLEPRASHIPERAQIQAPALQVLASGSSPQLAYAPPWPYAALPPRPAFMLARPEPIDVIADVPDGPPASFI